MLDIISVIVMNHCIVAYTGTTHNVHLYPMVGGRAHSLWLLWQCAQGAVSGRPGNICYEDIKEGTDNS